MRQRLRQASTVAITVVAAELLLPVPASGQYLDPGAASIIVQAVVAGFVAVAATLKLYWKTISGFWSRRRSPDQQRGER